MKTFECEVCGEIYDNKKDAANCCKQEKVSMVCNTCGKEHSDKKAAINCCTAAKKKFS